MTMKAQNCLGMLEEIRQEITDPELRADMLRFLLQLALEIGLIGGAAK